MKDYGVSSQSWNYVRAKQNDIENKAYIKLKLTDIFKLNQIKSYNCYDLIYYRYIIGLQLSGVYTIFKNISVLFDNSLDAIEEMKNTLM